MSPNDRECKYCHLKFSEFEATGLLGCPACYDEFKEDIDRVLEQEHGSSVHTGKRYAGHADRGPGDADVNRLTAELSRAIQKEEYETAALLRDKIRRQTGPGALLS
jgi:protein arginine kinase activator